MHEPLKLLTDKFDTPIGEMVIVADQDGNLRAVDWADHTDRLENLLRRHYGRSGFTLEPAKNPSGLSDTMKRYFAGELASIDTIPVATSGTTISYGKLAERIGKPNAVRAVGLANGSNPIGVVVPCHRVIGANGSLTGYGGGIERKRWLLEHEKKDEATHLPFQLA